MSSPVAQIMTADHRRRQHSIESTPSRRSSSYSIISADDPGETSENRPSRTTSRTSSHGDLPDEPSRHWCPFFNMSNEKRFILVSFSMGNFCMGASYSILAPFFPNEAKHKGMSSTTTGLVFGVFELMWVIMSPVYGTFLTKIGAKFMYNTGIMVVGCTSILFGFLDHCPPGIIYTVMCFAVRMTEGLGAAAYGTANFAMMAYTFPDNVATMFGILEVFNGLGMMIGPPIGGALFELGGFGLPFFSMGGFIILIDLISIFLLPRFDNVGTPAKGSVLTMLKIPIIFIIGLHLSAGSAAIGFTDITLSLEFAKYGLSPVMMGVVFMVGPGIYAFAAPFWGGLTDAKPHWSQRSIVIGYLIACVGFFFMGPAPFLPFGQEMWMVIVCLCGLGLGIGSLVAAFQVLTQAARANGYPDSLETYGLISGVFNSFFAFGAFIGPLGGGYLNDKLGFQWACVIISAIILACALLLTSYMIIIRFCYRPSVSMDEHSADVEGESNERSPLLKASVPSPTHLSARRSVEC